MYLAPVVPTRPLWRPTPFLGTTALDNHVWFKLYIHVSGIIIFLSFRITTDTLIDHNLYRNTSNIGQHHVKAMDILCCPG